MSNTQSEEIKNHFEQRKNLESKTVRFLIEQGIAKDSEQASKILIGFFIFLIILSTYLSWRTYKKTVVSQDDPRFKLSEETIAKFPIEIQEKILNKKYE